MRGKRLGAWAACAASVVLGAACTAPVADHQPAPIHRPADPAFPADPPATTEPAPAVPATTPVTAPAAVGDAPGWSSPASTLPPGGGVTSVACYSSTFCIAVGGGANDADTTGTTGAGQTQSWDGETWSDPSTYYPAPAAGPGPWPVNPAIACTAGPFCAIVDGSGYVANGDGTDWITPVALQPAPALPANPADPGPGHHGSRAAAVACPTRNFCTVVDNTGQVETWSHGSWLAPQAFGTPGPGGTTVALYAPGPVGVSCPSATACTAVVGTTVLDWDGTTWSEEATPWATALTDGAPVDGAAIACPTPTLCAVVSGPDLVYRNGGAGWSAPVAIDPGGDLTDVSCGSASFCVAVDAGGSEVTWNGTSWAPPARILPAPSEYVGLGTSVSCTRSGYCLAIDGDGTFATTPASGPGPSGTAPSGTGPSTTAPSGTPATTG